LAHASGLAINDKALLSINASLRNPLVPSLTSGKRRGYIKVCRAAGPQSALNRKTCHPLRDSQLSPIILRALAENLIGVRRAARRRVHSAGLYPDRRCAMGFPLKKLLVPIDGSEGAERAAAHAGELARLSGAAVVLLRVHSPDLYQLSVLSEIPPLTDYEYLSAIEKQMNDPAKDPAFEKARTALGTVSGVENEIAWGQAAAMICDYAKEHAIDQIVIGARGRSAFNALLVGSVCSQVLHHAPCPVTVVH
jgi:nucleotide-binding universal stress UspA family protein